MVNTSRRVPCCEPVSGNFAQPTVSSRKQAATARASIVKKDTRSECSVVYNLCMLVAICLSAVLTSPGGVSYVERSAGLEQPRMEKGNTEFEFGDVNNDGWLDILSVGDHGSPRINSDQQGIMVWFGAPDGRWTLFQTGNFGYGGIAIGDVNNDGLPDVAFGVHHNYSSSDFGDQVLEVVLGNGTGMNWTPWDDGLGLDGQEWGMFGTDFADVDSDGMLDVGSVSFGCCDGLHVYRNNGTGTWTRTFGFLGGNSSLLFTFAEINGDGHPDIVCAHQNGTAWFGDGAGNFIRQDTGLPAMPLAGRLGVAVGDVNNDGRDDLSFVNSSGGISVYTWDDGAGTWVDLSGALPSSGTFRFTQIADMDVDGAADIVAIAPAAATIYFGDGAGGWTQGPSVGLPTNCRLLAFRAGWDADHNGFPDFVYVAEENCQPFTGGRNRPRFFAEASHPNAPRLFPVFPRGGETFRAGGVRFLRWHAALLNQTPPVDLALSLNGLSGPWLPISAAAINSGVFQWRLPRFLPSTTNALLRYRMPGVEAFSPSPFRIIGNRGERVRPSSLQVTRGVHVSGGLDAVLESDDSTFLVEARRPSEVAAASAEVVVEGTASSSGSKVSLAVEVASTGSPAEVVVELFDWQAGVFVQAGRSPAPAADSILEFTDLQASRFLRVGDRLLRARVGVHDRGVSFLQWHMRLDLATWVVE
jgi:hypothetical protein